jgi:hypothetical protein
MEVKAEDRPPVQGTQHRSEIHSRALDRTLRVHDAREEIARASRQPRGGGADLQAFLESKREMIRSHARLTPSEKATALAEIDRAEAEGASAGADATKADAEGGDGEGGEDDPPVPGGVGYGVFYDEAYKTDFETGTAAEFYIICPTTPGGNVGTWLYLTAMNRASLGVEAFVSYYAQEDFHFKVFDWARADRWQIDLPFSGLGPYLQELVLYGSTYQALYVVNFTYLQSGTTWINDALLLNVSTGALDLVYSYAYESTIADQRAGFTGSWGPIVETFQNLHVGTHDLGFAEANVASRTGTDWGPWQLLAPERTYIRQDGVGFQMAHLEPNHTFIARS